MATGSLVRVGWRARLRAVALALVLGVLVSSVSPARAGIHWSSTDPVFTFQRGGIEAQSTWVLDVQVLAPLEQLPLSSPARLEVAVPRNVAVAVVNPPNPAFPVEVAVRADGPAAAADPYTVRMTLHVSEAATAFPVALLITDPLDMSVRFVEGVAGQPLPVRLSVGR